MESRNNKQLLLRVVQHLHIACKHDSVCMACSLNLAICYIYIFFISGVEKEHYIFLPHFELNCLLLCWL